MRFEVKVFVLVAALCVTGIAGAASAQDEPIEVFTQTGSDEGEPIKINQQDTVTTDEARKLMDEAAEELLKGGNPDKAIELCERAILGKAYRCYGHIGIAYKLKGDKTKACASFEKYRTHGSDSEKKLADRQMSELGCP